MTQKFPLYRKRQGGLTLLMNIFFISLGLGTLAVLGAGQVMYEQGKMQGIADLAALEAARQVSDGPDFTEAVAQAERNGLTEDMDLELTCLINGEPAPNSCSTATVVRADITRQFLPFFFLADKQIQVRAEATMAPLITGQYKTGLLSISTSQSALLNGLMTNLGGGEVTLTALEWGGLLNTNATVPLLDLALELNAGTMEEFLNMDVNALTFLQAAFGVARAGESPLPTFPNSLGSALGEVNFTVSDLLAVDLSDSTRGVADINLGQLIQISVLGAGEIGQDSNGSAVSIPLSVGVLGVQASVRLVEPPKIFVGRKIEGKNPIARATAAQAQVNVSISGLPPTTLGIPGLASASISGLNLNLKSSTAGGEVQVTDIGCRYPRADNTVDLLVTPSVTRVCISEDDEDECETNEKILDLRVSLLGISFVNYDVRASADVSLEEPPHSIRLEGVPPMSATVPTSLANTLEGALSNVDLNLSVSGNLGILGPFLSTVLSSIDAVLSPLLGQVGAALDDLTATLGIGVNNSQVDVQSVDCKSSILTY